MIIIADTSGLLASLDPQDRGYEASRRFLRELRNPQDLVVPQIVIPELGYWVSVRLPGPSEGALLRRLGARVWRIENCVPEDVLRAADLVDRNADFPLGTVDALLVAMAERLDIRTVFTLDRRHFGAVRPAHCEAFELVPELP